MFYVGSDHGGFELKEQLKKHLELKNIDFEDCGCYSTDSVDYPDFAKVVALKVKENNAKGLLICGTGIGISMAANKITGIRAGLCMNTTMARLTRLHNDANILCMGGRIVGVEIAKSMVDVFLETGFEGGRHQRRVDKMES